MIRTWVADVSSLLEQEKYLQYYKKVPNFRREKADKIFYQKDKALSVGAWTLFEWMIKEYGVSSNHIYNLSHSGQYALCSLDDSGEQGIYLGCDIEEIKQVRMEVARRFFCESEFQNIAKMDTERKKEEAFYRYWVLKESFMKATRLGMRLGLDKFEIGFCERGIPYLIKQPTEFPQRYFFKEYELENLPYKIAVCSNSDHISKKIKKVIL